MCTQVFLFCAQFYLSDHLRRIIQMRSVMKKAAVFALTAAVACGSLAGCGKKEEAKIDGTKTLLTVNGDTVSLGVGSFFARFNQAQIYKYYTQYFGMSGEIFDGPAHEGSDETYGDHLKESIITDLETDMVIRQHAEEYGVSLTDEEKKAIDEAASAYIANNGEEVLSLIGASKEDVVELMTLQTYQAKMMDPIVKDVDTEVSDEEGQVSSLSYVRVDVPDEVTTSGVESAAVVVEPVASTESTASSGAESVAEEVPETPEQIEAKTKAEAVIAAILAAGNVADADMTEIAQTVDDTLYSYTGQYTTSDPSDATVDANIVDAVKDLADGTLIETPIRAEDGTSYYVVRFDKAFDEERTETNKASIVNTRKQDLYDETTQKWVDEAEITLDEKVWETVKLTDLQPLTLTDPVVESVAESVASVVDVESIAEPVESAATEAISVAETVAGTLAAEAESAAEAAASTVEAAVETTEAGAASLAAAAESTVSEAAGAADTAK